MVLLTILIILVPVGLLIQKLFQEIGSFISYVGDQMNDLPGFLTTLQKNVPHFLQFLPDGIYASVSTSVTDFFNNLIQDFDLSKIGLDLETVKSGISNGVSSVVNVVKSLPSALLAVVIGIIAWILFTKDYDKVVHFIKLRLPAKHKNLLSETKRLFSKTIVKMFAGLRADYVYYLLRAVFGLYRYEHHRHYAQCLCGGHCHRHCHL